MRLSRLIFASVLLVLLIAATSLAQGLGGQGNSQYSQMREKYKYTFQLMQMTRHMMEIDKDPKYTFTKAQAKKMLGVLKPLRSKPKLTQEQAKSVLKSLKPIFTVKQLNAMAKIRPPSHGGFNRRGGGYGGNQGSPGVGGSPGGGQPGANRPRFDMNAMKDFNPFYSKAKPGDEFAAQRVKRWNQFFTTLEKKAKGKKITATKSTKTKHSTNKSKGKKA